ncbi:hypothetical protein [Bacillus toyonensis]|nr:hypothetical protein [Bacillus toyonensis]EEL60376.1 Transcriptional regulator, XRE [Bacillus cereus Rock4-18]
MNVPVVEEIIRATIRIHMKEVTVESPSKTGGLNLKFKEDYEALI